MKATYKFLQMPLPYPIGALAPYIDRETMELHYKKHLTEHIDALNSILGPYPMYHSATLRELILFSPRITSKIRADVRHHAGAIFNHNMFFYCMSPDLCGAPIRSLSRSVNQTFGSYESLLSEMRTAAMSLHGSGWVFLAADIRKKLRIVTCPNNETTLPMNLTPILALDMWEHAYHAQYQNRRGEYFDNWCRLINPHFAEELFVSVR